MTGGGGGGEHPLTVVLRIRPLMNEEELVGCHTCAHKVDNNMVVLMDPTEDPDDILRANRSREKKYIFDHAFDYKSTTEEVYQVTTRHLIDNVISGYNATVFAYGATGAGKTYTMLGTDTEPGIMYRTLSDLFSAMEKTRSDNTYKVTMSYLEIYNEMIRDLLAPAAGYLELREDAKGVQVAGLSEIMTKSTLEIMELLKEGNKERTQEPTAANKTSSRSHAILMITVKQKNRIRDTKDTVRIGKLFLIDLAGSERASNTHNRGKRMVEGAHINRSLLALGNCINALSDKNGSKYVNYRDSKLTRLLKDSLGGNCKTAMIAHISPASGNFEESRNTLVYADRAKSIKNKVRKNVIDVSYHIAQYTSIISELREEIGRLRRKLDQQELQQKSGVANIQAVQSEVLATTRQEVHTELANLKEQLITSFRNQMDLRRGLMDINNSTMEIDLETSRHTLILQEYEAEKTRKQKDSSASASDLSKDEEGVEKEAESASTPEPDDVKVARDELKVLREEKERTEKIKVNIERELVVAKRRAEKLEEILPSKISSEEQKEILSLLCKVHELEIENIELQSQLFLKEHEIRQKDVDFTKHLHGRTLRDEIIQRQRALLEECQMSCPKDLEELYDLYEEQQQEEGAVSRDTSTHNLSNLPSYKTVSITNMNRHFLEPENSEEHLSVVEEDGSSQQAINSKRDILRRSSAHMLHKEQRKDSTTEEDDISIMDTKDFASNAVTRTNSVPKLSGRNSDSSLNKVEIQSKTRNIAALAARKRTKAQMDALNTLERLSVYDREINKTFVSMNSLQIEQLPDSESYLTPSRLAKHDNKYGSILTVQHMDDDSTSVLTLDKKSSGVNVEKSGAARVTGGATKVATKKGVRKLGGNNHKRRTRADNPNGSTQLAKSGPPKHQETRGSTSNLSTVGTKKVHTKKRPSHHKQPVGASTSTTFADLEPQRTSRVRFPTDHPVNGQGELRELTPVSTSSSTVYQIAPEKGKGLTVQKKMRVFNSNLPLSHSPAVSTPGQRDKKPPPTIPANYRKGDIHITGFSLQR
ncbi:kinesin-like protein KIF19 isoform X2 [Lingula anatina]|uniref:Kinesin-like protein KIF19 n=1 Tax=Lingula anatina TaxID=7574 RepID=A0A1S3H4K2_LINAN|nr:kinesin-like protein KIF19 isoform X2 [Lingula anatina]XP_013416095.1 kinesin-like protein KIF19 isoform X2 [Lingula anatina]|eukprot:XP_013380933.1 kinesin-like protein KIF19 isoform X2 [Lingula anatina]